MAAEYKILEARQDGETLWTKVEYVIDGSPLEVDIAHFAPSSKEDVLTGIENRYTSETAKKARIAQTESVKAEVEQEIEQK